jgi:hypothetical protein
LKLRPWSCGSGLGLDLALEGPGLGLDLGLAGSGLGLGLGSRVFGLVNIPVVLLLLQFYSLLFTNVTFMADSDSENDNGSNMNFNRTLSTWIRQ